jgi:holdfast attachment protein HfaA
MNMTNLKTVVLAGAASAALATAAIAGPYDQSANYNSPLGMSGTSMNAPVNSSLRDENGNLEVVNGKITSSSFSEVGGVQSFNGGVGGLGGTTTATAIGNQLNVITAGSNNIVIVDSTQINNGDQNANANNGGQ